MQKILVIIIAFGLIACQKSSKKGEIDHLKLDFLQKIDLSQSPETVWKKLDSAKINAYEIYQYCLESQALMRKTRLIESIAYGMENNLEEENPEYWLAIMYNLERFTELINTFKEPTHQTFIDIGSGNGEKPYAALCLGFTKAYGLEYSQKLVKISQDFLKPFIQKNKADIIAGDALRVDGKVYQKIDFIYMYSPIKNHQKMAELCHKVMQNMPEGAILMEMRLVYGRELRRVTGLEIPEQMDMVLKKQQGKFYVAQYRNSEKEWKEVKRLND
jgi:16S rRNA G966 N2-methylase RsmD